MLNALLVDFGQFAPELEAIGAYTKHGGRINTDFIDNSAGVDCSDNEVNIKIPLNREMRDGRLDEAKRNALLVKMTDEVAELVLEDNRLQSLALSIAEAGGAQALPALVRTIEILEDSGRLNRKVEGLATSDILLRRGLDGRGLTRPELAVILSMAGNSTTRGSERNSARYFFTAFGCGASGVPRLTSSTPIRGLGMSGCSSGRCIRPPSDRMAGCASGGPLRRPVHWRQRRR